MSQFYVNSTSLNPLPPTVPTSFPTDSGTATPAGNILNVVTPGAGTQGIMTSGSGNTITISLIDTFLRGTATTTDGVTYVSFTAPANVPLPLANTAVSIRANLVGIDVPNGLAIGGELIGCAKNIGGVLTVVGTPDLTKNNDAVLASWTADLAISGTNVQVQVRGVAAHTINWATIVDFVIAP